LINLEGVGHDCNPSVAALRLIHMAGMTIHIALESSIHIAGIRTHSGAGHRWARI
jgi:hypothetical protein